VRAETTLYTTLVACAGYVKPNRPTAPQAPTPPKVHASIIHQSRRLQLPARLSVLESVCQYMHAQYVKLHQPARLLERSTASHSGGCQPHCLCA